MKNVCKMIWRVQVQKSTVSQNFRALGLSGVCFLCVRTAVARATH